MIILGGVARGAESGWKYKSARNSSIRCSISLAVSLFAASAHPEGPALNKQVSTNEANLISAVYLGTCTEEHLIGVANRRDKLVLIDPSGEI